VVKQSSSTPIDPQRRAQLLHVKLRALVRDHLGRDLQEVIDPQQPAFGRGAAIVEGTTAWVLLADAPERGLGAAMAWASRRGGVDDLAILTEASSGVLARRAALFDWPIAVWHVVDRLLVAAVPEPYPELVELDPVHAERRELIEAGGADPVVEHGVLAGEVRGLEVCRVVSDVHTGEVRLEVGVGVHDREAFLMLHGARPTVEALADVVETVRRHRTLGTDPHPLNRLGAERFLRWASLNEPERLGAVDLEPAPPPVARTNIKDPVPCVAIGRRADGRRLVAVYSTGIDLDLVPFAADARAFLEPLVGADVDTMLVVPARDASPVTAALAALATTPMAIVPWA